VRIFEKGCAPSKKSSAFSKVRTFRKPCAPSNPVRTFEERRPQERRTQGSRRRAAFYVGSLFFHFSPSPPTPRGKGESEDFADFPRSSLEPFRSKRSTFENFKESASSAKSADHLPFAAISAQSERPRPAKQKAVPGSSIQARLRYLRDLQLLAVPYLLLPSLIMTEDVKFVQMSFARAQNRARQPVKEIQLVLRERESFTFSV
jgi:hypothetical protein